MLVLSRTRDETIMIGDDIEITIVDVRGDKVRVGINAPATVPVHRKEVYESIKRENQQASRLRPELLETIQPSGNGEAHRENALDRASRSDKRRRPHAIREDCS
jgi:carbon storage regulator